MTIEAAAGRTVVVTVRRQEVQNSWDARARIVVPRTCRTRNGWVQQRYRMDGKTINLMNRIRHRKQRKASMTSSVVLITFRHFNCVGESAAGRRDDDYMRARGDKKNRRER